MRATRIVFLLTFLVAALLLFACSKERNPASTAENPSRNATGTQGQPSSVAPSLQNTNALTEERVQSTVQKAFSQLVRADRMAAGASAKVLGIQELPGMNAARADLDLTNAAFLQTDMLSGKWEVGPGGFGGRMVYSKKRIRIDKCTANLKHYTNGKWVLESLDTHSYEFGVVKVNVGLE